MLKIGSFSMLQIFLDHYPYMYIYGLYILNINQNSVETVSKMFNEKKITTIFVLKETKLS